MLPNPHVFLKLEDKWTYKFPTFLLLEHEIKKNAPDKSSGEVLAVIGFEMSGARTCCSCNAYFIYQIWIEHPVHVTMYLSLFSKLLTMCVRFAGPSCKKQVVEFSPQKWPFFFHFSVIFLLTHLTFQFLIPNNHSLPKTNSSPLKLVGILVSFWDGPFAGCELFWGVLNPKFTQQFILVWNSTFLQFIYNPHLLNKKAPEFIILGNLPL